MGGTIQFTKMHGLGNDFVVINAISQRVDLQAEQCRYIANRRLGVGCDQILLVEKPTSTAVDFRYRIFNADGSEVAQCGNGARCFARFVREQGLTDAREIQVETANGELTLIAHDDNTVTVDMGAPRFLPAEVPIAADEQQASYSLPAPDFIDVDAITFSALGVGNPHAVIEVADVDTAPVQALGKWLQAQDFFPESVNVGFMQIQSRERFRLRVYERGVGETRACGSGACAAMVAGVARGKLEAAAAAELLGGELALEYPVPGAPVMMTGATARVFEGEISVP